jgi:hypothetical protein
MRLSSRLSAGRQVSDLYDPRTQWASYIINALKVGRGASGEGGEGEGSGTGKPHG